MITCSTCEKQIKGNAVIEQYDNAKQCFIFICRCCVNVFAKADHDTRRSEGWDRWAHQHAGIDDDHDYSMNA